MSESITATHGSYNLRTQTGRFYDVDGSVQIRSDRAEPTPAVINTTVIGTSIAARQSYANSNPFLFRGRIVDKTGPQDYVIYDGSVTSCLLPNPDWQLFGRRFTLNDGKAHASASTFKLLGIPLLFLPYVTHPVDTAQRQSGLLIPVLGYSSASQNTGSKGVTVGEQAYLTLGRSADLTIGTLYYSLRGFSENGTFRYRGPNEDFLTAHFSALQDRGFLSPSVNSKGVTTNVYTNQGGEDVTAGLPQAAGHQHPRGRRRRVPEQLRLPPGVYGELQPGGQLRHYFHPLCDAAGQRLLHGRARGPLPGSEEGADQ